MYSHDFRCFIWGPDVLEWDVAGQVPSVNPKQHFRTVEFNMGKFHLSYFATKMHWPELTYNISYHFSDLEKFYLWEINKQNKKLSKGKQCLWLFITKGDFCFNRLRVQGNPRKCAWPPQSVWLPWVAESYSTPGWWGMMCTSIITSIPT